MTEPGTPPGWFDPSAFEGILGKLGHGGHLGMRYRAHGVGWVEMELPYSERLIGDAVWI